MKNKYIHARIQMCRPTHQLISQGWIVGIASPSTYFIPLMLRTGDAFTGDGWTALIREKLRLRGQLFSIWTSTELISILEINEWRMQWWSSTLKQNIQNSSQLYVDERSGRNKDVNCVILTSATV